MISKYSDKDFIASYYGAVSSINNVIANYKPDCILALIRKGPRLIELMQLAGLWHNDIPVITERALDYISPSELNYKTLTIFDDISVTGSTIRQLISHLKDKYYGLNINVVSTAIDNETFRRDSIDKGITFDNRIGLSGNERFIFSNELVKSFIDLNKPYDLDYSIFYTTVNNETRPIYSQIMNTQTKHMI